MKFTEAWANVAQENIILKLTVVGLVVTNIITAVSLTTFALKKPLLFERSQSTRTIKLADPTPTASEIEAFIRLTLNQRFETGVSLDENFFVAGEVKNRALETKDFESRGITQKVIVNKIDLSNDDIKVDADRILEMGQVKTILSFPLMVKVVSVDRNANNPYGLKIAAVTKIEKKEGSDGK